MDFNLQLELKKQNRFIVSLPDEFDIPKWVTKSATRPSAIFDGGGITWGEMKISFWDPIGPSTSKKLWDILTSEINKKHNFKLELLDPKGEVIESWGLDDCIITSIDFGGLNFDSYESLEPIMYFKPTKA